MTIKYFKVEQNRESKGYTLVTYFKVDNYDNKRAAIHIEHNNKLPKLITSAKIESSAYHLLGPVYDDTNKRIPINFNEYEDALKRAINHNLRELRSDTYFLVNSNELDKDLVVEHVGFDGATVVRRF